DPDIALLPSSIKPYIQGQTEIRIEIDVRNSSGSPVTVEKDFTIAGYFKAFPGVSFSQIAGYYWNAPIILNADPWMLIENDSFDYFDMVACIKTPFTDQPSIDAAAASMHLDGYYTLTNFTSQSNPMAISPLIDMPIFYQLLDLDYWLVFAISMFGIGIITFMKITAERKEIGLFRIRGFDNRMMYQVQLSEKYMPILVGALIGVFTGITCGIFVTNGIALNFFPYNPLLNYPLDIVFPIEDLLIQVIAPIVLYLLVILLAIKLELRQNLSSIIDEED
nr:FtsX-like permease family protein [Candidatus Sigynarchaeota archaeon]